MLKRQHVLLSLWPRNTRAGAHASRSGDGGQRSRGCRKPSPSTPVVARLGGREANLEGQKRRDADMGKEVEWTLQGGHPGPGGIRPCPGPPWPSGGLEHRAGPSCSASEALREGSEIGPFGHTGLLLVHWASYLARCGRPGEASPGFGYRCFLWTPGNNVRARDSKRMCLLLELGRTRGIGRPLQAPGGRRGPRRLQGERVRGLQVAPLAGRRAMSGDARTSLKAIMALFADAA